MKLFRRLDAGAVLTAGLELVARRLKIPAMDMPSHRSGPGWACRLTLAAAALATAILAGTTVASADSSQIASFPDNFPGSRTLVYDIVRDGAVVGHYRVNFAEENADLTVTTDVEIDISLLFIPVYSLRHHGVEQWENGELIAYNAKTDDNGRDRVIDMVPQDGDWRVEHDGELDIRPGAALIGTLWHPDTVNRTMLIDPMKGKLRDIIVTDRGMETITVPFGTVEARHISIGGEVKQEVWYGPDGHIWQADFPVKAGGTLTLMRRQ